jgi:hypothetical protein
MPRKKASGAAYPINGSDAREFDQLGRQIDFPNSTSNLRLQHFAGRNHVNEVIA